MPDCNCDTPIAEAMMGQPVAHALWCASRGPLIDDEVEVRYCPLGPPKMERRVWYAWCAECQHVRKSNAHCPMVRVDA